MTTAAANMANLLELESGGGAANSRPLASMLAVSVGAHAVLVLLALMARLPSVVERPKPTYEVSLVTLPPIVEPSPVQAPPVEPAPAPPTPARPVAPRTPAPRPAPAAPPKPVPPAPVVVEAPAPKPSITAEPPKPAPPPPVTKPAPAAAEPAKDIPKAVTPTAPTVAPRVGVPPVPAPRPAERTAPPPPAPAPVVQARPQVETKRPSLNLSDALKDIELPPEAPKLADIAPAEAPRARATASPAPSQNEVSKLLSGLNVPEPVAPSLPTPTAEKAGPVRPAPSRPTIDPELQRKLEQLQRPIERSAPAAAPPPVVASKPAPVRRVRPVTAQNAGPGSNEYLALVQRLISQGWFPPKVDVATDTMEVILRFRLNRDGRITDVVVEEQSGNDYYDDSARRAVLSAQVPAFRSDMAVPFLDVHFSFSVGQQNG